VRSQLGSDRRLHRTHEVSASKVPPPPQPGGVNGTPLSRTAGETSSASASRRSVVTRGSRSPRSIRETSVAWMPERWLTSSCVRCRRFLARETFCAKTSRVGILVMVL
jgi:hypothetical protein